MIIDNTALTMWQSCPLKYKLRVLDGWATRHRSGALGFGGALHEALAVWYRTHNIDAAEQKIIEVWPQDLPIDDWRTREKCIQTIRAYAKEYPYEAFEFVLDGDGEPLIEVAFTIPLDDLYLPHCERDQIQFSKLVTGSAWDSRCTYCNEPREPLEYGGIFDGLVSVNSLLYVLEHKSTSRLGSYYFDQFKPNNQISGYVWAARSLSGRKVNGAYVNAIGLYKASPTKFDRQYVSRSDGELIEWISNVWHEACAMWRHQLTGYWPMRTTSCTMYGACEFLRVHQIGTQKERDRLLEQDFIHNPWSHERRDENGADSNA